MKQISFTRKAVFLSGLLTVVILCGAIVFAASSATGGRVYSKTLDFKDMCRIEEAELGKKLCRFDKVIDSMVQIQASDDGEIAGIYIIILTGDGKEMDDSEKDDILEFVLNDYGNLTEEQIEITYVHVNVAFRQFFLWHNLNYMGQSLWLGKN